MAHTPVEQGEVQRQASNNTVTEPALIGRAVYCEFPSKPNNSDEVDTTFPVSETGITQCFGNRRTCCSRVCDHFAAIVSFLLERSPVRLDRYPAKLIRIQVEGSRSDRTVLTSQVQKDGKDKQLVEDNVRQGTNIRTKLKRQSIR
jgi:hypothetical protein